MSVVYDMMAAVAGFSGEPEFWVLGELALAEWAADGERATNYQLPAPPPGVSYERRFQGVPVTGMRSTTRPRGIELHGRDYAGVAMIKLVRW